MNEPTAQRYDLPSDGSTRGRDTLLDLDVTVATLDSDSPDRLARWLRSLPAGEWLDVQDAVVRQGQVVVVMRATAGSLAAWAQVGLPEDRRAALADSLMPTLDLLATRGLAPRTLDPAEIPVSDAGPLLVPANKGSTRPDSVVAILRLLGRVTGPPAAAVTAAERDMPTIGAASIPVLTPAGPAGPRRVGLSPAETGTRSQGNRSIRTIAGVGTLAAIVAAAFMVLDLAGPNASGAPARPIGSTQSVAPTPDEPTPTPTSLDSVVAELTARPADAGPAGAALRDSLAAVQAARGPARTFAAAGAVELVRVGRTDGGLVGPVVDRAEQVVEPLARPTDLPALIAMVSVDPTAFGSRGPKFLGRLEALNAAPTGADAAVEASELLGIVRDGPGKAEFTPTFAALAEPVLLPLAAGSSGS